MLSGARDTRDLRRRRRLRLRRRLSWPPGVALYAREDRTLGRNTCGGERAEEGNQDPCLGAHWGNTRQEPCCLDTRPFGLPQVEAKLSHHQDRKSTRLNSSHANISYAVFCLK